MMPPWFKAYLQGLPNDLAKDLYDYVDGMDVVITSDLASEIMDVIDTERERRKAAGPELYP